jgi:hypothetical protein
MTAGDLCTLNDVVNECLMSDQDQTQWGDQINTKITDISNYIKSSLVSGNPNLIGGNTAAINTPDYYAFQATKYGVLEWLESHYIVKKSENVIEMREGKILQKFSDNEPDYPSYSELYGKYKRLLMGTPAVGSIVHTPHNNASDSAFGPWWPP